MHSHSKVSILYNAFELQPPYLTLTLLDMVPDADWTTSSNVHSHFNAWEENIESRQRRTRTHSSPHSKVLKFNAGQAQYSIPLPPHASSSSSSSWDEYTLLSRSRQQCLRPSFQLELALTLPEVLTLQVMQRIPYQGTWLWKRMGEGHVPLFFTYHTHRIWNTWVQIYKEEDFMDDEGNEEEDHGVLGVVHLQLEYTKKHSFGLHHKTLKLKRDPQAMIPKYGHPPCPFSM
ncbi:hypothetical protein HMI54_002430 [Coelomomyces lativittatus]|nr:hypothetical protein HMI56_001378 [Coelomomyces lativittatus]KAJ1509379.1 hypothetical protein HMI54_002430 [Coelomomyces lativittatus]KAJ1510821.1 hypothetical protein HMI55_006835 [Coelomomyces lativittatus]